MRSIWQSNNMSQPTQAGILTGALVFVKLLLHGILIFRYGIHVDELYFIECAHNFAAGYVDHGPLVVWLTWLSGLLFGYDLPGLRVFSVLAGGLALLVTLRLVREFGGGRLALVLTGMAMILAPAYLRMNKIMHIPAFEVLFWGLGAWIVVRILKDADSGVRPALRDWLLFGLVLGLGLLTKITIVLWAGGLLIGLILTGRGLLLRDWRPYAGGCLALLIFAPNLIWQYAHEWPTIEFARNLRDTTLAAIPRSLFLLGQVLYIGPFALPIWAGGLVWLVSAGGRTYRFLAVLFVVVLGTLLLTGGKPYYAAAVYPAFCAAGGVFWEDRWRVATRRAKIALSGAGGALTAVGFFFAVLSLPILPLPVMDRAIGHLLGAIIKPQDLTFDLHLEYGWRELAGEADRIMGDMPPEDRARTAILTPAYATASAFNFFGKAHRLPRAYAPHMTYYLWGPPPEQAEIILAYGYEREELLQMFGTVIFAGTVRHPLAVSKFQNLNFFICRDRRRQWSVVWPRMKRFHFAALPLRLD